MDTQGEGLRRASSLDTSYKEGRHCLPPLSQPGTCPGKNYHAEVIRPHSLFGLAFPLRFPSPEYVDEASSKTRILANCTQPHNPCPRDPGHLPRGINSCPLSPPINLISSLKLFRVCVFFAYAPTVDQGPGQASLPPGQSGVQEASYPEGEGEVDIERQPLNI